MHVVNTTSLNVKELYEIVNFWKSWCNQNNINVSITKIYSFVFGSWGGFNRDSFFVSIKFSGIYVSNNHISYYYDGERYYSFEKFFNVLSDDEKMEILFRLDEFK